MMTRYSGPFATRSRWVYDAAARRQSLKACRIISAARQHVFDTATIENEIDMDYPSYNALLLLDTLSRMVTNAENDAHREARLREEGVIGGRYPRSK